MTNKVVMLRVMSRSMLAMTLSLLIGFVLLSLVFYSDRLDAISEAGWALFGVGIGGLSAALLVVVRAIAQNPSDREKITEEE